MIYREHADGTRYVYILAEDDDGHAKVYQQKLNDNAFVGQATRLPGSRLKVGKDIYDATGILLKPLSNVDAMLTSSKSVITIHDDIVTMRRR
jgi:hypothetical protein